MFDDLLPKPKTITDKIHDHQNCEFCPACGSIAVEFVGGWIVDSNTYSQTMICKDCTLIWKIIFDADLNVVKLEMGV